MFAGGKEGVIFLLNRNDMGKLEGNGAPLQRFQAGEGCGHEDCAQTLGTAFWSRRNDGVLYVWDRRDVLRAYNFINNRFVTTPAAVSAVRGAMTGGPSVSANGSDVASGIVWAVTTHFDKGDQIPGTLRAFRASDVSREIYNTDMNSARDALGDFTRFAPPVVANGKVYVATQSKAVSVYGLLCGSDVSTHVNVDGGRRKAAPNNTYTQSLTVKNTASHALGAPFDIVLDNLTPGVTLTNVTGATACGSPAGSPVIRATSAPLWLVPGASFTTALTFTAPSNDIRFRTRVISGSGGR
jgi:uncharacterized protein YcbK (DUF882 family)